MRAVLSSYLFLCALKRPDQTSPYWSLSFLADSHSLNARIMFSPVCSQAHHRLSPTTLPCYPPPLSCAKRRGSRRGLTKRRHYLSVAVCPRLFSHSFHSKPTGPQRQRQNVYGEVGGRERERALHLPTFLGTRST